MNVIATLLDRVKEMASRIRRSNLARNAGGLAASTVLMHGLWAVALVVMDRIYTQQEIGTFSVFMAYALTLAAFSLLSYPLALPKIEGQALKAMISGLLFLGLVLGLAVGVAFFAFGYPFAWMLALATFFGGLVQLCEQVNIRDQRIRPVFWSRTLTRILFLGLILSEPFRSGDARSIILAHVASLGLITLVYAPISLWPHLKGSPAAVRQVLSEFREHGRFPAFIAPAQALNVLAYQFPTIILDASMGAAIAAQYSVTVRFCASPITVLAGAVGRTYHARLARVVREGEAGFFTHFKRLCGTLAVFGVFIAAILAFLFPPVIQWLLGPEWQLAGEMARLMAPLYGLMLLVSGVGSTLLVFKGERYHFASQVAFFLISLASFGYAAWADALMAGVALFAGLGIVRYLFIFGRIWRLSRAHLRQPDE